MNCEECNTVNECSNCEYFMAPPHLCIAPKDIEVPVLVNKVPDDIINGKNT